MPELQFQFDIINQGSNARYLITLSVYEKLIMGAPTLIGYYSLKYVFPSWMSDSSACCME